MTYTNRFDGKGKIYAKARPKYAAELFEYLKNVLKCRWKQLRILGWYKENIV